MQRAHALAHQLQHVVDEALDPGLQLGDPRPLEQPDLVLPQIGLRLVEEVHAQLPLGQQGHEVLEVGEVQDVVRDLDVAARMALHELRQLLDGPRRRLAAVGHGAAVEPAERAVHPLAPPAAARALEEQARAASPSRSGCGRTARSSRRSPGWAARPCPAPARAVTRAPAASAAAALAGVNTPGIPSSGRPSRARATMSGKTRSPFAGDDGVHERELARGLRAHGSFAVGAAHHDHAVGPRLLQAPGQGQARDVLVEAAREARPRAGAARAGRRGTRRGRASACPRASRIRRTMAGETGRSDDGRFRLRST